MSSADVAGLTPEQITQLMQVEIARGKERETLLGTVFDALYKREAGAKLKAERLAIPEAQRLARLKERREQLEVLRKTVKTTADIKKIDVEARETELDIQKMEAHEAFVERYKDRIIDLDEVVPELGLGKMRMVDIFNEYPQLIGKVIDYLAKGKEKPSDIEAQRKWIAAEAMRKAGVSDLAGLKPGMRDLVMEVQDRAEAFWAEGKGLSTLRATTKAWREAEASFKAMKKLAGTTPGAMRADRPTIVRDTTIEWGNARETLDLVRGIMKTKTRYTNIFKLLVDNGWTEVEAKIIMRAAMDTEFDREKILNLIDKERTRAAEEAARGG